MSSNGRSPYPTRSRARRLQQQQQQPGQLANSPRNTSGMNHLDESTSSFGSSFVRMGQGLVQARVSPANNLNKNKSTPNQRFFGTASVPPSSSAAKPLVGNTTSNVIPALASSKGPASLVDGMNLTQLRALAHSCLGTDSSMAVFYASIVYAKSQDDVQDAFLYAQTLFQNGQVKRCVRLLESSGLLLLGGGESSSTSASEECHWEAVVLAGQALASLEEWNSVLLLLEDSSHYSLSQSTSALLQHHHAPLEDDDDIAWQTIKESIVISNPETNVHPLARICCLRGQAYAETGHPLRAARFWKRALQLDPLCVQALDWMLERSVVPPDQALQTILGLTFPPNMTWLRALYLARVQVAAPTKASPSSTAKSDPKASSSDDPSFWQDGSSIQLLTPLQQDMSDADKLFFPEEDSPATKNLKEVESALDTLWNTHKLQKSSEVLALAAKRAYRRYDLKHALEYCRELAAVDPLCQIAGFIYVSTLVALGHKRILFQLAHEWVDAAPKSAKAWFAVGAYYFSCGRYHVAQRHFCRATRLDPHCPEAWVAFGTSFAACDESDQALASFRAAQRLAPGDHTSLLYIGMEYLRTNHLVLAQHFLQAAHASSSGSDALCLNELGVLSLAQKNYSASIRWFRKALGSSSTRKGSNKNGGDEVPANVIEEQQPLGQLLESVTDSYWEPTVFNLGQAYRKTRQYERAAQCLERCLTLRESASAYAALAFCKHLQGDLDGAILTYHESLSRKPDNPFCTEMLHRALTDALDHTTSWMGEAPAPAPPGPRTPKQHATGSSFLSEDGLSISVQSSASDVDMG